MKLFGKSKGQIDSLVQTVHIFSEDINMKFGIRSCGVEIMQKRKVIRTYSIRLPDWQGMKDIDENGYTYLGILETDRIKEIEIKKMFSKEYMRQFRLILRSKLNGRSRITAFNALAVFVMKYGAGILK